MCKNTPFMLYLALLSMLGFLATDMYLPAFSAIQHSLQSEASEVSASLTVYLGGFALAQGFWGAMSDRHGRRPVLLAGLTLFSVACLGMVWIDTAWQLLALRFFQAVGVCAAAVSWQALVVDRYPGKQAERVFATIMPLVALSPALAPLVGAWLLNHFAWQAIFVLLAAITVPLLLFTLRLPTRPAEARPEAATGWLQLLNRKAYTGNVLIYAACSASFFAWLTGSPFILASMGLQPVDIGLSYIPQTVAFLLGGFGIRALLSRCNASTLLPWLLLFYAVSVTALCINALQDEPTLWSLLLPFCGMALANGAIYPVVVAAALRPWPQATGKAAALQNMLQLGLCFIASLVVSTFIDQVLLTTSLVMLVTIFLAILGYALQLNRGLSMAIQPSR